MIRSARLEDAAALLGIYAPYVEHTAITFELQVPGPDEFGQRMEQIMRKYPYLVWEEEGNILGYAYASDFHPRAAYRFCAEMTVYVAEHARGRGIGRTLYSALEDALKGMHYLNFNACIACTDREDPYLDDGSPRFHEHMGYRLVGTFHQCGYKFGRWYDMIWMEKTLPHPGEPEEILTYAESQAENRA